MTGDATPNQSDAIAQARAKSLRLANAFVSVFGKGARRSEEQRLVLGHLAACAGDETNSYRFNDAKDGVALIAAGIHRDGAKSILLVIERQIQLAEKIVGPKKAQIKTQR